MEDSDNVIKIPRQSCCRLCLAPDSECVSIFGTTAADKQPISVKIQACVSIQVNTTDRLSGQICHVCISFLNSWASFKTRCFAAQRQQKSWLAGQLKSQMEVDGEGGGQQANKTKTQYNYLPQYHRDRQGYKPDPKDSSSNNDDDTGPVTLELDPAAFLAGGDDDDEDGGGLDEDDDDGLEEGEFVESSAMGRNHNNDPQILNALGLRNVNMNPMGGLSGDMLDDFDGGEDEEGRYSNGGGGLTPGAQCRVCAMKFSNRANARRHEKNLHGLRSSGTDGGSSASGSATPVQKMPSLLTKPVTPATGNNVAASPATARKPAMDEEFDYSRPEKYRHLLTESRLAFIKRNARFLRQYQDMTCKCCDRKYFTYKTFMSHMRKKYTQLPRNMCYNCLIEFETKGQFIAHLKKRHCVNLFTVFMADGTIPKDAKLLAAVGGGVGGSGGGGVGGLAGGEQRLGLKELLSNKVYGCQICQEQFRLKNEFRSHVTTAHPELQGCRDPVTGNCRHCHATFADSTERKRHFSGLDCLVTIICSTCDNQFTHHNKFLDHVYGYHLKEMNERDHLAAQLVSGETEEGKEGVKKEENVEGDVADVSLVVDKSRASVGQTHHQQQQLIPKKNAGCVCPICEKQYNNYYNVLWHFESKHPEHVPKTYRCEVCEKMFTKQQLLKSHVLGEHAEVAGENGGGGQGAIAAAASQGSFKCRHCDVTLERAKEYIEHQVVEHPDEELLACHECEFVTEEREKLEEHLRGQHLNLLRLRVLSCTVCRQSFVSEEALKCHAMVQHAENESSEQLFKRMLRAGKFPKQVKAVVKLDEKMENDEMSGDEEDDDEEEGEDSSAYQTIANNNNNKHAGEEEERVRECPICVDKFPQLSDFVRHMKRHVETDNVTNLDIEPGKSKSGGYHSRMRCRRCQKRISSRVGYKRHLLEEHGIDHCAYVRCDLCPGEFSNEKGLKVHLYRTHNICVKEDGEVITLAPPQPPTTGDSKGGIGGLATSTTEYECQICHTVYRSLGQLRSHVSSVHQIEDFDAYIQQYGSGEVTVDNTNAVDLQQQQLEAMSLMMMSGALLDTEDADMSGQMGTDYTPIEVYFQCRYCDDNFSSRQKLTAHMNTHDEHDPTDYTCRECGNVYQSRKSLWVHRNKKHPKSQVPSPCEICKKVFFDKTELVYHLKTHVAQKMEQMELMNALMGATAANVDDVEDGEGESGASEGEEGERKYDCHVCNRKFRDEEKFSKHLRFHEMQNNMFTLGAFTEAGMDDEGGASGGAGGGGSYMNGNEGGDPFEPQYNDDGVEEYVCDMCPKRFPQLMALRVHRGWHYRSPDGRQITEPGQTWQPGSLRSQRGSKGGASALAAAAARNSFNSAVKEEKVEPVVAMIAATTTTTNNNQLSRSNSNSNHSNTGSVVNPRLPKCQFCSSTFASANNLRRHIVEVHKRNDWRAQQGNGRGFVDREKECSTCNKTFETRAEWVEDKMSHARTMRPSKTFEWNCEMCGKVFTRKERLLQHMASHATEGDAQRIGGGEESSENSQGLSGEDDEEEGGEETMVVNPDVEMLGDDDDDDDFDEDDEEEGEDRMVNNEEEGEKEKKEKSLCCDLCQVEFTDEQELRKHVLAHFFNGGIGQGEKKKKEEEESLKGDAIVVEKKELGKEEFDDDAPKAKKMKIDIPEEMKGGFKGEELGEEEEEEEEGEYVEQRTLDGSSLVLEDDGVGVVGSGGGDEAPLNGEDDMDEGEYVEEYFDEDSFVSPKKAAAAAGVTGQATPVVQQQCRLCSTGYENTFKALKCLESHRQRSKYQCSECELYFATPKQLSGHQQLIHAGEGGVVGE